jgi:tetratricopeptide (TPR) repeat protein
LTLCATASANTAASLDRGYGHMYNLEFPAALSEFRNYQQQNFADPVGYVSEASCHLFSELSRLGVLEARLFSDDKNFEKRQKLEPDPHIRAEFDKALERAELHAQQALAKDPNNKDALFAMALSNGLKADYSALIEKKNMASLGYTRDAGDYADKLIKIDPSYYDGYLASGLGKYIIGSMAAPVRWMLRLGGIKGDKEGGRKELRLTAEKGRYLKPFARLLLAVGFLRDKDKQSARELLVGLRNDFPQNPLFGKEIARIDGGE